MAEFRWLYVFVLIATVDGQLPEYHQNDYDIIFERAGVVWYNQSVMRDLQANYPFYNRTTRALNASGYLLHDMTSTELVAELQLSKFLSNEYRYFPLALSANICQEYANNNFNAQDILRNVSNLTLCPLKKGLYYIYNFIPDYSRLPPFIPRGRFKNAVKLYYNKQFIGEAESYFEIVDKQKKWWK